MINVHSVLFIAILYVYSYECLQPNKVLSIEAQVSGPTSKLQTSQNDC